MVMFVYPLRAIYKHHTQFNYDSIFDHPVIVIS